MENNILVIGIAGGTGSGKTTLMDNIIRQFGDVVTVLSHDNYYRRRDELTYEQRTRINYDEPAALETELMAEHLDQLRQGKLTSGHARALLSVKEDRKQTELAQKIIALDLSVRQTELLCKNLNKEPTPKQETFFAVDYVAECEKTLSKHLGRGVKIINGKRKGRFELEFYGQEDLQVLLDALLKLQK